MTTAVWAESSQLPLLTILSLQASASKPNLSNTQSLPCELCAFSAEADSYELNFLAVSCYFRFLWFEALCDYLWAPIRSSQLKTASLLHSSFPCKLWATHCHTWTQLSSCKLLTVNNFILFSLCNLWAPFTRSELKSAVASIFPLQLVSSSQAQWAQVRSCQLVPTATCGLLSSAVSSSARLPAVSPICQLPTLG